MDSRTPPDDSQSHTRVSSGVDALLTRLREEGVARGREQAEQIVSEARSEATRVLDQARSERREIIEHARETARRELAAGRDALQAAARDAILEMKATLVQRFVRDVERLVAHEMAEPELLRRMVLEVAGRAREEVDMSDAGRVEVVLPRDLVGLEELRREPERLQGGSLSQFALKIANDMLREGVTFRSRNEGGNGIRVRLVDRHVELELTDQAVAAFLLGHLQPRFRAILEGIVR